MSASRKALDGEILSELRARIAALREQTYEALARLPEVKLDELTVLGQLVKFTAFRELQADGSLLILVRSDRPSLFGAVIMGTTEGFSVLPSGEKRDACPREILDFFD